MKFKEIFEKYWDNLIVGIIAGLVLYYGLKIQNGIKAGIYIFLISFILILIYTFFVWLGKNVNWEKNYRLLKIFFRQLKNRIIFSLFWASFLLISYFLIYPSEILQNEIISLLIAIAISSLFLAISNYFQIYDNFKILSKLEGKYEYFRYKKRDGVQTDEIEETDSEANVKYIRENELGIVVDYKNNRGGEEQWKGIISMQSPSVGLLPWRKTKQNGEEFPKNKMKIGFKQIYVFKKEEDIYLNSIAITDTQSYGKELYIKEKK